MSEFIALILIEHPPSACLAGFTYHPIVYLYTKTEEEAQMKFYTKPHAHFCDIDLHARCLYVCILIAAGETLLHKKIPAYPNARRDTRAMDEMGILPFFKGVLCHDHWKPYYQYKCLHALCNAHHLRELEKVWEQDGQQWAKEMQALLIDIAKAVDEASGQLAPNESKR